MKERIVSRDWAFTAQDAHLFNIHSFSSDPEDQTQKGLMHARKMQYSFLMAP